MVADSFVQAVDIFARIGGNFAVDSSESVLTGANTADAVPAVIANHIPARVGRELAIRAREPVQTATKTTIAKPTVEAGDVLA